MTEQLGLFGDSPPAPPRSLDEMQSAAAKRNEQKRQPIHTRCDWGTCQVPATYRYTESGKKPRSWRFCYTHFMWAVLVYPKMGPTQKRKETG